MATRPEPVVIAAVVALALGCAGVALAWWMRRRTTLSIRNLYPAAVVGAAALTTSIAAHAWGLSLILLPLAAPWVAAAVVGSRWRSADLGAGEELRNHELARRWIWQPAPERREGERLYLRSQGELIHERAWPEPHRLRVDDRAGRAWTAAADRRRPARRPVRRDRRGEDDHGATVDRRADARAQSSSSGARPEGRSRRRRADAGPRRAAGVPFILFDSQDPNTDRWQPLWGSPDVVAARAVEPIKQSEPYYYDVLRRHLDVVCKVLHAAEDVAALDPAAGRRLPADATTISFSPITKQLGGEHDSLKRRAAAHGTWVTSPRGMQDLSGGAFRLEVALALAGRNARHTTNHA